VSEAPRVVYCAMPTLLLVSIVSALLAAPSQPAAQSSEDASVRAVEDRRIKALVDDDFTTLEAIFADDLHYTHSSAVVDDKASYMAALRSGKTKYETIEPGPVRVAIYGDTALMTGTAMVGLRGRPEKLPLRYTLVYVKQGGQWRMVAWQSTRMPG
jgi:ketosteroid isomerase-like protein